MIQKQFKHFTFMSSLQNDFLEFLFSGFLVFPLDLPEDS